MWCLSEQLGRVEVHGLQNHGPNEDLFFVGHLLFCPLRNAIVLNMHQGVGVLNMHSSVGTEIVHTIES